MGNGKANNVLEYLDNLVEKGKATTGAVRPLKIAFTQVVKTVDGDTWESTNVRDIEIDDYMGRFANLTMGKYNTESLTTYKSRFNKVIRWYIQFMDKPGWTPDVQTRNRIPKASSTKQTAKLNAKSSSSQSISQDMIDGPQSMPDIVKASGRVLYPYPLLDGQLVHISLPVKLSKIDAKRIGTFIESIAIEVPLEEKSDE